MTQILNLHRQLNQISQILYAEANSIFEQDSVDASRVMFASMMATGAAALLGNDGEHLRVVLKDIGKIIDQINIALMKQTNEINLN